MADVFNKNPSAFVNMNDLFPVLNDKVGLTSTQWQKAIENANYLYNHLGLADVGIGRVETVFTQPGTLSDVVVSHREVTIDDKTTDYFDFIFYIPSPQINSSITTEIVQDIADVGITMAQTPIMGTGIHSDTIIGYTFNFLAKILGNGNFVVSDIRATQDNLVGSSFTHSPSGVDYTKKQYRPDGQLLEITAVKINGTDITVTEKEGLSGEIQNVRPTVNGEQVAYLSDITNAITVVLNTEV